MMRGTHVMESLSAYLDDELAPRERERVAAHLETCEDCRRRYESLRAMVTLVRDLDPLLAPDGLRDAVRTRLARTKTSPRRQPSWARWLPEWRPSWRMAWAAVAVVLIGLFSLNLLRSTAPPALVFRPGEPDVSGNLRPGVEPSQVPPLSSDIDRRQAAPKFGTSPAAPVTPPSFVLRRVIRTASLFVEVDDFDTAVRRLIAIAEGAGGFVASSSYTEGQSGPSGTFVLRVPAPGFANTLAGVETLGRVRERRISGQDVSEEFVDIQARVRNLERHEQRLLSFMDRATKVSDLLAIEQELARVRGEIEALTGRLRVLGDQVDLASIEVAVRQKPEKVSGGFWDFGATLDRIRGAFLNTVRQILVALERLAVVASALVPVLALGALAWLFVRRLRARAV